VVCGREEARTKPIVVPSLIRGNPTTTPPSREYGQQRNQIMNWNQVEGNWEEFKGKVQKQWGKLTNDDLDVIKGNRKELAGKLQKHYGKAQEDVEREIDDWSSRL